MPEPQDRPHRRPSRCTVVSLRLDGSSGYLIARAQRLLNRALAVELAPTGVAPGQFPLLVLLWHNDDMTPGELSAKAELSEPTVVRTLDRMERDGLVRRLKGRGDGREVRIRLTRKAHELKARVMVAGVEIGTRALFGFAPQDKRMLSALLQRLIGNLAAPSSTQRSAAEPVCRTAR